MSLERPFQKIKSEPPLREYAAIRLRFPGAFRTIGDGQTGLDDSLLKKAAGEAEAKRLLLLARAEAIRFFEWQERIEASAVVKQTSTPHKPRPRAPRRSPAKRVARRVRRTRRSSSCAGDALTPTPHPERAPAI